MPVLVVVAHPDDEVLGCGGFIASLSEAGVEVAACILSGSVEARTNRPVLETLQRNIRSAGNELGMRAPILGNFPNLRFNRSPHVELVQFIETAIVEQGTTSIITHHPSDLNDDHLHTSRACQAAARLFQRRPGLSALRSLHFMEVQSSTDWAFRGAGAEFSPDTFVPLGTSLLERKLAAIRHYAGVMRDYPHPRSELAIRGLAAYRGSQAGVEYAEAFQTAFTVLAPGALA